MSYICNTALKLKNNDSSQLSKTYYKIVIYI